MKKRSKPLTAGELMAQLNTNPEFLARKQEHETLMRERAARFRVEQEPLLADLREVGLNIQSVWDLVNTSAKYEQAIPVLLRHLSGPYSERTKEGIARALAVRKAQAFWPQLAAEYRRAATPEDGRSDLKSGLAAAVAGAATEPVMGDLVALAKDRSHGSSRLLFLRALRRSKAAVAKRALEELSSDPDVATEIASWKKR